MKLLYFAKIRESLDKSEEILELPQNINTTGDLIKFLTELDDIYKIAFSDKNFFIACDEEVVEMDFLIKDTKEIAIFPPVTGG